LLAVYHGKLSERALHARFRGDACGGEWFAFSPDLEAFIKSEGYAPPTAERDARALQAIAGWAEFSDAYESDADDIWQAAYAFASEVDESDTEAAVDAYRSALAESGATKEFVDGPPDYYFAGVRLRPEIQSAADFCKLVLYADERASTPTAAIGRTFSQWLTEERRPRPTNDEFGLMVIAYIRQVGEGLQHVRGRDCDSGKDVFLDGLAMRRKPRVRVRANTQPHLAI
jgi:hypothetical protein